MRVLVTFLGISLVALVLMLNTKTAWADNVCDGTVRVLIRQNQNSNWSQNIALNAGDSFVVGTFINGVQTQSSAVLVRVLYPNGMTNLFTNGDKVQANVPGTWEVGTAANDSLRTPCTDQGAVTITVNGANLVTPTPFAGMTPAVNWGACVYNSTQARVQEDVSHAWNQTITISQGSWFNVGGFHNGTGQFSSDTAINVHGPNGYVGTFYNGNRINAESAGTYTVTVVTSNQSGSACQDIATVKVIKGTIPTPTLLPLATPSPLPISPVVDRQSKISALVRWILHNRDSALVDQWLTQVGIK